MRFLSSSTCPAWFNLVSVAIAVGGCCFTWYRPKLERADMALFAYFVFAAWMNLNAGMQKL